MLTLPSQKKATLAFKWSSTSKQRLSAPCMEGTGAPAWMPATFALHSPYWCVFPPSRLGLLEGKSECPVLLGPCLVQDLASTRSSTDVAMGTLSPSSPPTQGTRPSLALAELFDLGGGSLSFLSTRCVCFSTLLLSSEGYRGQREHESPDGRVTCSCCVR